MCSLFGFLDYKNRLSINCKHKIVNMLARECEVRGTDATGVAYISRNRLHIFKRPMPAHLLKINIPVDCNAVMGHTRLVTKGAAKNNYNNHPFKGSYNNGKLFALAHNGVLNNDIELKKRRRLPFTKIKTDSFVAVQLIEEYGQLSMDSLKHMAELVQGSFTFTVLDEENNLFIIKGSSPLCIYDFYKDGFYIYASTEGILKTVLVNLEVNKRPYRKVDIENGEILCFDSKGNICRGRFNYNYPFDFYSPLSWYYGDCDESYYYYDDCIKEYLYELKMVARSQGYSDEQIDWLIANGFSMEEIETFIYDPEYWGGVRF